ncbi:calponin homology domain-containing protein [Gongronella butleri]|nr:calponin homology domain-containing protein [Gongronella butleri]
MATESRVELVQWVNELLQSNYTNAQQAGTGVAYCQIMDSIFGDVHLSKVKFQCRHEYEYIQNFKVLQRTFVKHKIDKAIPVEQLVKCKFQENLAFLQWIKGYWDEFYPGGVYDAVGRRQRAMAKAHAVLNSDGGLISPPMSTIGGRGGRRYSSGSLSTASSYGAASSNASSPPPAARNTNSTLRRLRDEQQQLILAMDGFEKERDFYFGKLQAIEAIIDDSSIKDTALLASVRAILYANPDEQSVDILNDEDEDEDEVF